MYLYIITLPSIRIELHVFTLPYPSVVQIFKYSNTKTNPEKHALLPYTTKNEEQGPKYSNF